MTDHSNPFPRCVYARPLIRAIDRLPSNIGRSSAVHSLIGSLDLLQSAASSADSLNRARVMNTGQASRAELEVFHDAEYVDFLLNEDDGSETSSTGSTTSDEYSSDSTESKCQLEQPLEDRQRKCRRLASDRKQLTFGLEHDCPRFPELPEYVKAVAGASLEIARELREGLADIGIVWDGGRHHAQQANASGFCYVNDVVLSIIELRRLPKDQSQKKIDKVLYVDLDVHHGDGVEAAFHSTSRVLTISVHYYDPKGGFFPLTGSSSASGPPAPSPASSHALNIPVSTPDQLIHVTSQFILPVLIAYHPEALVLQCGVDGLAGDPLGGRCWGLGLGQMGNCISMILDKTSSMDCKVLLLGGGGYHRANAARAWAYITSIVLGRPLVLNTDIPPDTYHYMEYAPSFTLDIPTVKTSQVQFSSKESDKDFKTTCSRLNLQLTALQARYKCKTLQETKKHSLLVATGSC
ncbi:hypothetical protein CROQUDRAFT_669468 [Cronartium quercuum f. sp. fusiforme G11]|uniref:histone deacetylase n=1 Tax=Cronartium quercuum f. sp. fusiforme G11 TaxID=708437 RepID=A0A9P6TE01_9BASI|nr:hypothetical protein CROQUDRAFT_669468 [Cronartium quercuum f. sp. fusiforme G11]